MHVRHSCVYRARVHNSERMVALKKIKMEDPRPEPQRDGVGGWVTPCVYVRTYVRGHLLR